MRLTFLGGAETVTGSRTLVEHEGARLLVDCGLFQGVKRLRLRNWGAPPPTPQAVVLTHAHIDHAGYLPRLAALGFHGPVYCTPGTRDLLRILLPDAGHLQEEEARHANRHHTSRHDPALPLFTREDAEHALELLEPVGFGTGFEPVRGVRARFGRAGHIVGSAWLALEVGGAALTFSGDVGRPADPIMRPPVPLPPSDVLVIESTYGDRRHTDESASDVVARAITETAAKGGVVVVPAFAVGRAQHLLHVIAELAAARRIPRVPVFLDSPMAIDATDLFTAHPEEHRLSPEACARMAKIATRTRTADESKEIDRRDGPMVIVSASGMATGGRVLHHLARFLPDERTTVLLVGYAADGTRARSLRDGADELKIYGQYVRVRARTVVLDALSAHADHAELLAWLRASAIAPRRVLVNHGEPGAADALRRRLHDAFGWTVAVAEDQGVYDV